MIVSFNADSADSVWREAVSTVTNGSYSVQGSRLGYTHELLHVALGIRNPRQRWISSRIPPINPAFAIAEAFWILAGCRDAKILNFWNPALPKFSGHAAEYHGAYGYRLRKQFSVDQLERGYLALHSNPESRQVVLQIWDPRSDLPSCDGTPVSADIPCNICSLLKIRNSKLEWLQIMRSNDAFRGTPYNFVQFTTLQEVMAGWLEVEVGTYSQLCDSFHVYEKDLAQLVVDNNRASDINADNLSISKPEFDTIFPEVWANVLRLSSSELCVAELELMCNGRNLPVAYRNLILILAADAARRHNWMESVQTAIGNCTNPALLQVWRAWESRCARNSSGPKGSWFHEER